jgi:phosphohistidine phosphatase
LIGSILRDKYTIIPDIIFTSPARRAKQTAGIISRELNYPAENIREIQKLYSASINEFLQVIHNINEEHKTVIMIGHNPELTELSNTLSGKYIDNIPTCGVVKLTFETSWKDVKQKNCRLEFFIYPKLFKPAP